MKNKLLIPAALAIAFAVSAVHNGRAAFPILLSPLGVVEEQRAIDDIIMSIKQYNKNSAGFYSTAGDSLEGLAVIPASQLLKRRLFQDINMLKRDGLVMVFDLDSQKVKHSRLLNRTTATATTEEVWAIALQDVQTRKPLSNVKAITVSVRYLLHYELNSTGNATWVIYEADVYPKGETVPDLNIERVL